MKQDGQGLARYLTYVEDISRITDKAHVGLRAGHSHDPMHFTHLLGFDYGGQPTEAERKAFKAKLDEFPVLTKEERHLLYDRYLYGLSFEHIAQKRNFTSASTAAYFYRSIKAKMRETAKKGGNDNEE